MNKRTQKPPITVSKVAAGYGVRVGASRIAIYPTQAAAEDAARDLVRSGEGTLRKYTHSSVVKKQGFAYRSAGIKRALLSNKATPLPSKPRPDSGESETRKQAEAAPNRIRVTAAEVDGAHRMVIQFMVDKDHRRRRSEWGAGAAAIAGLIGSVATALAANMSAATSPGQDTTLLITVGAVTGLAGIVLSTTLPDLLKNRTKTNAWAAKVAGTVWDAEMAASRENERISPEGRN